MSRGAGAAAGEHPPPSPARAADQQGAGDLRQLDLNKHVPAHPLDGDAGQRGQVT